VEIVGKGVTRQRNIMSVICDLVGVHHSSGDLDRADEVEEVVAQVISELFNLLLCHVGAIRNDEVVDRKSSGDCCLVSDHIEIKACLSTGVLNQTLINNSARSWVLILVMALLSEPSIDTLVN